MQIPRGIPEPNLQVSRPQGWDRVCGKVGLTRLIWRLAAAITLDNAQQYLPLWSLWNSCSLPPRASDKSADSPQIVMIKAAGNGPNTNVITRCPKYTNYVLRLSEWLKERFQKGNRKLNVFLQEVCGCSPHTKMCYFFPFKTFPLVVVVVLSKHTDSAQQNHLFWEPIPASKNMFLSNKKLEY